MPLPPRNLLTDETSPYLHQHKDNPVYWRAWTTRTLDEAKELDRPILLSIGYAACHWCHVMAHESFEDADVAAVMNRLFVNIKVDREERPDIDQVYMAALTATGEQGGWPLTMFLTPDAKPFWGGTYFPRVARYGRPGFVQVLESVHAAWVEKRTDLVRSAESLARHVQDILGTVGTEPTAGKGLLSNLAANIHSTIDQEKGGNRGAPKFPNAPFMRALWQNWLATGDTSHRDDVLLSLRQMLAGGIYDHIGGGLCRYSTDEDWLVPHFEKMLYDNAQLVQMCCWAYAETGDGLFRIRIEETIQWLLDEMRTPGGAFASSLDADSEGREGQYYTWTRSEIESILGRDAKMFFGHYALKKPSHWEGDAILKPRSADIDTGIITSGTITSARRQLLDRRRRRIPPARDDKNLTDWNGLAIASLAVAGRQFSRRDWIDAAEEAFACIEKSSNHAGRLPHSSRAGRHLFPALSSDLASMATAAIRLHEATRNVDYLNKAQAFVDQLDMWYADHAATGYYLTASDSADTPMRIRGDVDEAIPSATSQIVEALSLLGDDRSITVADHAAGRATAMRYGQAGIINACAIAHDPLKLVVVDEPGDRRFADTAARYPDPRRTDIPLTTGERVPAALPDGLLLDASRPGAWLCAGMVCLPALDQVEELAKALRPHMAG